MTQVPQRVYRALERLNMGPVSSVGVQRALGSGPTNEAWLVEVDQALFVLRLVTPFATTVGQTLAAELRAVQAAHEQGIAPETVASSIELGAVLSRYVAGRPWTCADLQDHDQLTRLAGTLGQLHQMKCDIAPLDLRGALEDYATRSSDPRAGQWCDQALAVMATVTAREPVVCHNDLTAANIIDNGRLCLIDWEYTAMGDPLFDLAVVVAHHELDEAAATHFLRACYGKVGESLSTDLQRWCAVYRCLRALWESLADSEA